MAVRLRPQQEGGSDSDSGSTTSGASDDGGEGGSSSEGFFLPAFRFERRGLAFDEYHAQVDAPCEEELVKRVEAALSLARPEDTSEFVGFKSSKRCGVVGDFMMYDIIGPGRVTCRVHLHYPTLRFALLCFVLCFASHFCVPHLQTLVVSRAQCMGFHPAYGMS